MNGIRITFHRTANFLQTTFQWLAAGGQPVSTKRAIARSEICAKCEFNVPEAKRGGCPACFSRKAMLSLFGYREGAGKKMKFHKAMLPMDENPINDQLTYCGKCGCDLKLKVFIPFGVIANEKVEYPRHCWQKTDVQVEEEDGD